MENTTTLFTEDAFAPHGPVLTELVRRVENRLAKDRGKAKTFRELLRKLPEAVPSGWDLDDRYVRIGNADDLRTGDKKQLEVILKGLHPWRKGPFDIFGRRVDCEWRSDLKWDRVKDRIQPLHSRRVLDIGSSSGYYMFRMLPAAPRLVIGLEPYLTFYYQFQLLRQFIQAQQVYCLPIRFDEFPVLAGFFDTIFCMGILYHSRAPLDMLARIRQQLTGEGELVLETLIIEGREDTALCPYPRYAKMNNAYFLPTVRCLEGWLKRAGFTNIRCVDVTRTTPGEQRQTDWMTFESLTDFLDSEDPTRTVEGYPAPVRAILLARPK